MSLIHRYSHSEYEDSNQVSSKGTIRINAMSMLVQSTLFIHAGSISGRDVAGALLKANALPYTHSGFTIDK